jgi:DeoR/GlpR family transcriptional regulator of sugar metabolism
MWDGETPVEETLDVLDTLVHSGKVRYIACSNFSGWHVMKSLQTSERLGLERYAAMQIHYTLQVREAEYELLPIAIDQHIGVLVWGPRAGGLLSGKYRRDHMPSEGGRHLNDWGEPPVRDEKQLYGIVDALVEVGEAHNSPPAHVALAWLLGRPAIIVQKLQEAGFVEIARLSAEFSVDRSTIRRDLLSLERQGLVLRNRGGALPGPSTGESDIPYAVKRLEHTSKKRAIGRAAAGLVANSDAIILDAGSTTFQVALQLRKRIGISVITNDLAIATCFSESPGVQLVVTGGVLLGNVFTLVGSKTVNELKSLNVDWAFLGADAVDHDSGITNVTFAEVEVKRAMIAAARRVAAVADSSKFGHRTLAQVCPLEDIDVLVTDDGLLPEARTPYGDRLMCVAADATVDGEDSRTFPIAPSVLRHQTVKTPNIK